VRECIRCQTAREGTQLSFTLASPYLNTHYNTVSQIIRQWRRIGVLASDAGANESALYSQTFDAYLLPIGGQPYENADPDLTTMLTPAGDVLNPEYAPQVWNFGSYNNPEVTRLVEQARTLPGCDPAARAEIYHQVERLFREDLPFLYVVAPDEFYAAAPNVLGFAPRTGDPLWNIESWVVSP
jgi:ABC-type transport system substrate-binding protein